MAGLGNIDVGKFLANNTDKENNVTYDKASIQNQMLNQLAKDVEMKKIIDEDIPLKEATDQMLVAAQGLGKFTYLVPELTTANRISNAIKDKNIMRVTGLPSRDDIIKTISNPEIRDKNLWRATGNGLKINAWQNSYGD